MSMNREREDEKRSLHLSRYSSKRSLSELSKGVKTMTLKEALSRILEHRSSQALTYAIAYTEYALSMIERGESIEDIRIQCLYVRNNLSSWRGDVARNVKSVIDDFTSKKIKTIQ